MNTKTVRPRLLIVDDDSVHIELVRIALQEAAVYYEVRTAATLAEARAALDEGTFDLILADWRLPDGAGVDLAALRDGAPGLPLVLMTGFGDEARAVDAMRRGALDYVVKSERTFADLPRLVARGLLLWSQIEARRAAEEAQRHLTEVLALSRAIGRLAAREESLEGLAERALQHLAGTDSYNTACLLILGPGGEVRLLRSKGLEEELAEVARVTAAEGLPPALRRVLESSTPIVVSAEPLGSGSVGSGSVGSGSVGSGSVGSGSVGSGSQNGGSVGSDSGGGDPGRGVRVMTRLSGAEPTTGILAVGLAGGRSPSPGELKVLAELGEDLGLAIGRIELGRARHRAETSLAWAEKRLNLISESATDAVTLHRLSDGHIIYASPAVHRVLGVPSETLLGKKSSEVLVHPEDFELVAAYRNAVVAGLERPPVLHRVRRADGTWLWVETSLQVVQEEDGDHLVLAVTRDVHERVQVERALVASEARFQRLFMHAPIAYQSLDGAGRLLEVNDAWCALFGRSRKEVIGRWMGEFLPEEDHGLLRGRFRRFRESGHIEQLEFRVVHKDGRIVTCLIDGRTATDAEGRFVQTHCVLRDVTAQQEAERVKEETLRRLNTLLANLPGMAYRGGAGPSRPMTLVSQGAAAITGHTAEELSDGRQPFGALIHPDDREAVHRSIQESVAAGRPFQVEYRLRLPDGERRWVWERGRGVGTGPDGEALIEGFVADVTERRAAERRLAESEARYRTIFDQASDGIWVVDPSTLRIRDCNLRATAQAGRPRSALVGRQLVDLCCSETGRPGDRALVQELSTLRGGADSVGPWPTALAVAGGHTLPVEITGVSAQLGGERVLILQVHDTSVRRWAERAIRDAMAERTVILDHLTQEVTLTDPELKIQWANRASCGRKGRALDDLVGRSLGDVSPGRDGGGERSAVLEAKETGRPCVREIATSDGRTLQVRGAPICDAAGRLSGLLEVTEDVTEIKRAGEELQMLYTAMEQSPESIIITDREGRIRYVNPAFERTTGYARSDVAGRNPRIIKSGAQDAAFYEALWGGLSAGETWTGRIVNKRKDGQLYTVDASISAVLGADQEITHFVGIQRDVTREIHLQEQLRQALKMEAVGKLAGGVAHDFNNLLTVILAGAELMRDELHAGDPLREDLQDITDAAERAEALTRQLLAFSRRQVLQPKILNINDLVGNVQKMLGRLIGEHILLETSLGESLPAVKADPGQIEQVLMNLTVNARDAMPLGGRLDVRTACMQLRETQATALGLSPGVYVRLEVEDTGEGMSAATRERIFEPFFTTKAIGKGTGLGLSTVYGIVKQHAGHIDVKSALGAGTRFRVLLPMAEGEAGTIVADTATETDGHEAAARVLVVEDESPVRKMVVRVLERAGFTVVSARDGVEALTMAGLEDEPFDLLLTDVIMPGPGGRVTAERLVATYPNLKVLFMSGYTDDTVGAQGRLDPGVTLLQKPFSTADLIRTVRECLAA